MPIVLDATDKSIGIDMVEVTTNQPEFLACYGDHSSNSFVEGSNDGTLLDAQVTPDVVPAPAVANTYRVIKYLSIHNAETSQAITITVYHYNNSAGCALIKKIIPAGSTLVYHDDIWELYNLDSSYTDGWIPAGETWTPGTHDAPSYVWTISGDKTTKYYPGQRVKVTQDGGIKYLIITKVTYSAPNTTITAYGGTDYTLSGNAITYPYFSMLKAPIGFPLDPIKWSQSYTDTTLRSWSVTGTSTWYNLNTTKLTIPIGAWDFQFSVDLGSVTSGAQGITGCMVCASTANNSMSDADLAGTVVNTYEIGDYCTVTKRKYLLLTAKTDYFLNVMTLWAATVTIYFWNTVGSLRMVAVCAYL